MLSQIVLWPPSQAGWPARPMLHAHTCTCTWKTISMQHCETAQNTKKKTPKNKQTNKKKQGKKKEKKGEEEEEEKNLIE